MVNINGNFQIEVPGFNPRKSLWNQRICGNKDI